MTALHGRKFLIGYLVYSKWAIVSSLCQYTYCSDMLKLSKKKKARCGLELIELYVSSSEISMKKKYQRFLILLKFFYQCNWKEKECNNKMSTKCEAWVTYKYILHGFCKDLIAPVNPVIHSSKDCKFHLYFTSKVESRYTASHPSLKKSPRVSASSWETPHWHFFASDLFVNSPSPHRKIMSLLLGKSSTWLSLGLKTVLSSFFSLKWRGHIFI